MKGGRKNWDEHETKTTNDTPQERRNSRRTLLINGGKLGCRPGETQRDNLAVLVSGRLTGALLDCLTHHVNVLEMNGDSSRLKHSKRRITADQPQQEPS